MTPDAKRDLFSRHPFFGRFGAEDIDAVIAHVRTVDFGAGELIFARGDEGRGLLAVVSGTVKISVVSPEGREIVLSLMQPGDIFGEMALLDGLPRSADATAVTSLKMLSLDRREFLPLLRAKPDLALGLVEMLSRRLRKTSEQVEDVVFRGLGSRLARVLLRMGGETPGAVVTATQKQLGDMIGMSRESTNKQLRAWEKRGWVRLGRGTVTIRDPDALDDAHGE